MNIPFLNFVEAGNKTTIIDYWRFAIWLLKVLTFLFGFGQSKFSSLIWLKRLNVDSTVHFNVSTVRFNVDSAKFSGLMRYIKHLGFTRVVATWKFRDFGP